MQEESSVEQSIHVCKCILNHMIVTSVTICGMLRMSVTGNLVRDNLGPGSKLSLKFLVRADQLILVRFENNGPDFIFKQLLSVMNITST